MAVRRRPWLFLFLFSLALRLLYLQGWLPGFETRQTPVYGDAAGYYLGAVVLRGGDPGQVTVAQLSSRPNAKWGQRRVLRMMASRGPGYVGFLVGVFSLFGEDPWPVRYVQALLGALTCVFVGWVGRDLVGRGVGWVAAGLAAVYPSHILFTGRVLTEVLASFLLWLGMYALVRGARARSLGCLLAAGAGLSMAALVRPTLLATIPLLCVAVAVMLRCLSWRRRLFLTAAFSLALLAPVASWNVFSQSLSDRGPIAGVSGFETVSEVMRDATAPNRRGWSTDVQGKSGWEQTLAERPLYILPAGLNLIVYHLWHVDDLWREARPWMRGLQRFVVVFALAGLGLSLLRWRDFAPLLGCLAALVAVSIKWIEIRPNLPFLPILFILAGLSVVTLLDRAGVHRRNLALGAIATAVLLSVCQLFPLARLFPNTSPTTLGLASDRAVLALALGWGALLWHVFVSTTSRGRAAVAAWTPALLFVFFFGSYVVVRSEPRWRAWEADLAELGDGIVQTVEIPASEPAGPMESAVWLVDLQTPSETPPLRVGLNGTWLEPGQYSWSRLFCPRDGSDPSARWKKHCRIYREGISDFTAAFEASPQWWGLKMDPRLVSGQTRLALRLAWDGSADEPGTVGGTFFPADRGRQVYGPSVLADKVGIATSLYRWHVAHDWRLWETSRLDAGGSASRLDREPARGPRSPRLDYISKMMWRDEAHWNIRLRLVTSEGRQFFF
ncbi:MAG: glycosyltransferase family 39 protein [Myxococcota bacterium]